MPCIDGARKPEHCAEARQPKRRPPKAPWNRHQPRATRRRANHEARKTVESADRILYVPGNHEYYGNDIEVARGELARQCLEHGVTLLDRGAITIDDVRFIGATVWTDLRLEGVVGEPWAHREVGQSLSDFTGAIRDRNATDGLFTTQESARRHAEDRAFIESELSNARDSGLTPVVISHHAPHRKCIRPWFAKNRLNPGFASDLEEFIARYQPPLWVHGHMHDRVDEWLGDTHIIANPHGYSHVEGHSFDPALVLEV